MAKKTWNADEMQGTLISDMEQEVKAGYQKIGQGGGELPAADGHIGDGASVNAMLSQQGQSQNTSEKGGRSINIELPLSLHTRLKIACASQNRKIKDIVPEIIAAWVEQVENK